MIHTSLQISMKFHFSDLHTKKLQRKAAPAILSKPTVLSKKLLLLLQLLLFILILILIINYRLPTTGCQLSITKFNLLQLPILQFTTSAISSVSTSVTVAMVVGPHCLLLLWPLYLRLFLSNSISLSLYLSLFFPLGLFCSSFTGLNFVKCKDESSFE